MSEFILKILDQMQAEAEDEMKLMDDSVDINTVI
jgi:hypothetical protein